MTMDERLGRIDQRLEILERHLLGNGQPGACARHGMRISGLERWRWYVNGALAVIGVMLGAAITLGGVVLAARLK